MIDGRAWSLGQPMPPAATESVALPYAALQPQANAASERGTARSWDWKRLVATGMTAVTGLTACVVGVLDATPGQITEQHTATPYLNHAFPSGVSEAPPPTQEGMELTRFLLDLPTDAEIINLEKDAQAMVDASHGELGLIDARNQRLFEIRQKTAERYGLTVFNATNILRLMREDIDNLPHKQLPFDEFVAAANEYLGNFGVKIEYDTAKTAYAYDLETGRRTPELDARAKRYMQEIVESFSRLPAEFVHEAGIRRLLFASQKPNTIASVSAYVSQGTSEIVYNTSVDFPPHVTFHELWHKWDAQLSGGNFVLAGNDPTITALNNGAEYGKAAEQGYYTVDQFWIRFNDISNAFNELYDAKPNCLQGAEAATKQVLALGSKTVFVSEYAGAADVSEQKAEDGEAIPDGDFYSTATRLNPWTGQVKEQFIVELARLASYRPSLAAFFIRMSNRSTEQHVFGLDYFTEWCAASARRQDPRTYNYDDFLFLGYNAGKRYNRS